MSAFGEGVNLDIAMRIGAPAALLAACLALLSSPEAAQTKLIDEVKIGGLAHDVTFGDRHLEERRRRQSRDAVHPARHICG